MMMCSYNNQLNGMILPDQNNVQSKNYGNPSRMWAWFNRKRDFWWKNTYTMNKQVGMHGYRRSWRKHRKQLRTFHRDSKLAPNLRRGKIMILHFEEKVVLVGNIDRQPSRLVSLVYYEFLYIDKNKGWSRSFINEESFYHIYVDQLEMIWYDNLNYDQDESENLDDRNHLFTKKFWWNYIPDYQAGTAGIFGP